MTRCKNCDSEVSDRFCGHCGQPVRSFRLPVLAVFTEIFEDVFQYDSAFINSIRLLLTRPGLMTKEFINGKRYSFIPPVRTYLALSLLLFFLFQLPVPDVSKTNFYIGEQLVGKERPVAGHANFNISLTGGPFDQGKIKDLLLQKEQELRQMDPQLLMNNLVQGVNQSISTALIFIIPLAALALKLLNIRRNILYYDHLIFALHFQSFVFLWLILLWALSHFVGIFILMLLSLVIPVYLLFSIMKVYEGNWFIVSAKTIVLFLAYLLACYTTIAMAFMYVVSQI